MNIEHLKKEFVPKYTAVGEPKFYRSLLFDAINKLRLKEKESFKTAPNIEFLEWSQQFLTMYRREGDQVYLEMSRIFRRAAHKIYRALLKKKMITYNPRFLNLV
jgi:hypothetical protein